MYAVVSVVILVQNDFCGDVMMRRPETYICKYNRMPEHYRRTNGYHGMQSSGSLFSMMEILSCMM